MNNNKIPVNGSLIHTIDQANMQKVRAWNLETDQRITYKCLASSYSRSSMIFLLVHEAFPVHF